MGLNQALRQRGAFLWYNEQSQAPGVLKPLPGVFDCPIYGTELAPYPLDMELTSDRVEVSVRLLTNGKYTWVITANVGKDQAGGVADFLKHVDGTLRDSFPNHVQPGSGKVSFFDE